MLKGGLETRLFNYLNYFLERGDEVTLVTAKIDPSVTIDSKVEIIQHQQKRIPKPVRPLFFNRFVKKVVNNNAFDFALSLERTSAQPYLIAPNTHLGYLKAQNSLAWKPTDWIQNHLDKISYQSAKQIFACSEMVKQEILDLYGISAQKVNVVYPPIDLDKFKSRHGKETVNLDANKINCLLVSTSHKRKGLPLLQRVFSQLDPDRYHLYVAGTPFQSDQSNVTSLGFQENLVKWYSKVDYLLHPAIYEPFGQIVTEAIACGAIPVVSENTGAKEIVLETQGSVLPLDEKAWIDALKECQPNPRKHTTSKTNEVLESLRLEVHMKHLLADFE